MAEFSTTMTIMAIMRVGARKDFFSMDSVRLANTALSGEGPWPFAGTSSVQMLCWAAP